MELADGTREVVDPEVRAYVSSLVTALGGSGADEDGRYVLGDDALACLRDLKRWLKLYDEKANRLDVARCLAESNLVGGDLLQILAAWPENATDDRIKSKIALACVELLVPLTWPLEKTREMTVNHHRHTPYLQLAQLGYKRSIINFDGARILHTGVRVALPAMAQPLSDRSSREQGIIKLVLYFIRNMAMVAPPPGIVYEGDEAEISRSATIDAFDYQDILHFLLTLSSSMGEEFSTEDVVVMEIIFHLIKGVDIEKLFMNEQQLDNQKTDELVNLRNQEAGLLRGYKRTAPSRHNRFGTMIWVQRDDHKMSVVSGQNALINEANTLAKMDASKKFRPPKRAIKGEEGPLDFDTPEALSFRANKNLRSFVEEFLDSGFNPLFQHIRKAIDREAERVLDYHPRQFFYIVSWFLEAERIRRQSKKAKGRKAVPSEELDSFALVASVLNQEMFITLNRSMENAYETKAWQDLNAAMRCFTQILLTVQEMSESPLEEDQDIAENILNRIFYEETTHDRIANIVRYYKDQGFGYLDSCTELAHTYLRILEQYSKQNLDLQIRSKRRTRRKKKAADGTDGWDAGLDESDHGEDEVQATHSANERKFDFKRFANRFLSQGCIDTFVVFCKYYNDLRPEQLKRVHRFFYRVAFKMEMSVMLFRVDIIHLLHKMIKGPEGMDPASPVYKEWDELVKQILKRCVRKIQERPELIIEMLFSKTNGTAHYLEYGYERQTIVTKPRPAADLEVKGGKEWEEQIAIVVSALLDKNEGHILEWVKAQLSFGEVERRAWEASNRALVSGEDVLATEDAEKPKPPSIPLKPDTDLLSAALFKNGHLRLLLNLISLQNLSHNDEPLTTWIIPSALTSDQLKESYDLIKAAEFSPPIFDDGATAEDQIRRKSAGPKKRAEFDDDSDGIDDDEILFPPGGPTTMKPSDAIAALKKSRRKKKHLGDDDEGRKLTDEERADREAARRANELEKNRKIKSALYVVDSDEESDAERDAVFFEQEEKLRQKQKIATMKELLGVSNGKQTSKPKLAASKKRKLVAGFVDSDSEEEELARSTTVSTPKDALDSDAENDQAVDTPMSSSPRLRSSQTKRQRLSSEDSDGGSPPVAEPTKDISMTDAAEVNLDEDDDDIPAARSVRRRVGAFVDDSDDE